MVTDEFKSLKININSFSDNVKKEKAARAKIKEGMISFGIEFLDRVFLGLMPSDILLLGAKTGQGKTTLVSQLALNMAKQGKRVSLFALEARDLEIEQRLKYACYCRNYYADPKREYTQIRFPNWLRGDLDFIFSKYDDSVDKEMSNIENLNILYRTSTSFDLDYFEKAFLALESKTDVFIIDHLHYFDTDGQNENKEFTDITKKIRDLALLHNKSIILVAHIRKKTNFQDKSILPTIDDFHGSSNITKIATKVLTIASFPDMDVPEANRYGALMSVAKFREDGSATRYVGLLHLDQTSGQYVDKFLLGTLSEDPKTKKTKFEELPENKKPWWSR